MLWKDVLTNQLDAAYETTSGLMDLASDDELSWKPAAGSNWMTEGQLLRHLADACGTACRGFVTGDWGLPEGVSFEDMPPSDMLPPAEEMPTVDSVAEATRMLAEDKKVALEMVDEADKKGLISTKCRAPWDPRERALGEWILQMIAHLEQHKAQLFYYLKLQGKPVNTSHLWS